MAVMTWGGMMDMVQILLFFEIEKIVYKTVWVCASV